MCPGVFCLFVSYSSVDDCCHLNHFGAEIIDHCVLSKCISVITHEIITGKGNKNHSQMSDRMKWWGSLWHVFWPLVKTSSCECVCLRLYLTCGPIINCWRWPECLSRIWLDWHGCRPWFVEKEHNCIWSKQRKKQSQLNGWTLSSQQTDEARVLTDKSISFKFFIVFLFKVRDCPTNVIRVICQ